MQLDEGPASLSKTCTTVDHSSVQYTSSQLRVRGRVASLAASTHSVRHSLHSDSWPHWHGCTCVHYAVLTSCAQHMLLAVLSCQCSQCALSFLHYSPVVRRSLVPMCLDTSAVTWVDSTGVICVRACAGLCSFRSRTMVVEDSQQPGRSRL